MILPAAMALLAAQPLPPVPVSTVDYSKPAYWLCLPGRVDTCSTPLPTTALNANGYGSTGPSTVNPKAAVDCFYVYPTVSSDDGLNSDLIPGGEEKFAVQTQFARFAGVCLPFVPVYRQMTLASVAAAATGANVTGAAMLAYSDVRKAWHEYLLHYNQGRPFVLIGHSQGSLLLQQLIAREIEGNPELAKRMKLAILPGFNVLVPQGRLVGGTFRSTPLCSVSGQTNCVATWTSFREKNEPPPGAMFGYADRAGMTVGCVNPANFGARSWAPLDSYWYTRSRLPVAGGAIQWSSEGPPATPYVRTEGLASARCVNAGSRGYLSIRTNVTPGGKRTNRIGGEVALFGMFLPGWGMHLADVSLAQGDLIRAVGEIERQARLR